jgi:hypothetical protein
MKRNPSRAGKAGYVSYLLVLSTGAILSLMMVHAHRQALMANQVQATVQLRLDYQEKEDSILRSIVAITPNRAIRAMQHNSNLNNTNRNPLRWQNIFTESLDLANARTSIPSQLLTSLNVPNLRVSNTGDSALGTPSRIFRALNGESGFISAGINRSLGAGFPPALNTSNTTTSSRDLLYPIISDDKRYGALADGQVGLSVATYPDYNLLTYPQINFGYARPGDPFVAKRNWWGFSVEVAGHDVSITRLARLRREFVLSIYEIPSQLAISASSFMALGEHASGEAWQNVTIDGGVFAGRAVVQGDTALPALASRRGMSLSSGSTVGGQSFANNPFTPGVREAYQMTEGEFFPVSLASESGRVAFIPINRGADYFDRFSHTTESSTLSQTTWNSYSVGALQCAMRLDITKAVSAVNKMPTELRFSYMRNGVRETYSEPLVTGIVADLPRGYVQVCDENQTFTFNDVVDVAYGKNGRYYFQTDVTGPVAFTNARFGDPIVGTFKGGFFRPSPPYRVKMLPSGKICIAIYPQRIAAYLNLLGANNTTVNNSLVVNVDYTSATGSTNLVKPSIPCTDLDYGLIIQESADLSSFPRGFSLVTNLRTYFGDDFNVVPVAPPAGYTPAGDYYPPVSMFMPEKRFGVEVDPYGVNLAGQLGSLASETAAEPVRPIDSLAVSGSALPANRIRVNLRPITHPAELPPITMKNWLVVLEELRKEFIDD